MQDMEQVLKEQIVWSFLIGRLGSPYAAAAFMGNFFCESGLRPQALEYEHMKAIGMNSAEYTSAVDSGAYDAFVTDAAGYGIAQWTWGPRKARLLEFARSNNVSVGDLEMQLEFLWKELNEYFPSVLTKIGKAEGVKEASDIVISDFESPADMDDELRNYRASICEGYYQRFTGSGLEE